jgi:hypothetical protein
MERRRIITVALVGLLVVSFVLPAGVSAQSRSRRGGLYGDWRIKMQFGENEWESILAFSRNQEGYTGQWIISLGILELKDVKFEDNKLSFTSVANFGGQERTSKFTGKIEKGELSGLLVGDERETEIKGKRVPRMSLAVGSWDMKITIGERERTGILAITADKEGKLSGMWKSERGESKLTNVKYQDRKLTFHRVYEREGTRVELDFEGTVGYTSLEGAYKSDRGEVPAKATRVGAPVIGTWNLDIESERRPYKQRLRINRDMSALYGSRLIKKIDLDGDKISFKYVAEWRDQRFDVSFEGKIAESKLTGELTTSQGTSKVTGAKRQFRRRGSSRS